MHPTKLQRVDHDFRPDGSAEIQQQSAACSPAQPVAAVYGCAAIWAREPPPASTLATRHATPDLASDTAHPTRGSRLTAVADSGPGDQLTHEHGGRALLPNGMGGKLLGHIVYVVSNLTG
jgi:hypothetical protein